MDSLVEKEVLDDVEKYADELNENNEFKVSIRKKKEVEKRRKRREKETEGTPGSDYKEGGEDDGGEFIQSKFLSNETHYSPADPDARISAKPSKPRDLNYLGQIAVDTSSHVITGALAASADKRDSRHLPAIVEQTIENLESNHLEIDQLLADKGYSSAEALKYCEDNNIDACIPNFGQYKPEREGFIYNKELDQYECQRGNKAILHFKGIRKRAGYGYRSKQCFDKLSNHTAAAPMIANTVRCGSNAAEEKQLLSDCPMWQIKNITTECTKNSPKRKLTPDACSEYAPPPSSPSWERSSTSQT
jgi:hypothetical protein